MYSLDHYDLGTPRSNSTQQVSVEIDGHSIMVPAGTSIMRAAASVGEQIPKLCATDTLRAFGSCRLCLVEIDGFCSRTPQPRPPASDGSSGGEAGLAASTARGAGG